MKSIAACFAMMGVMVSVCRAELSPRELLNQIREAFGPEWTVSTDFVSMVAIRRDAKLLGTRGRIDPVLLKEGEDLWDDSISSDFRISIFMRPKLTEAEFRELSDLRKKLVEARKPGFSTDIKNAFGQLLEAEGTIELPDFYIGDRAIYFSYTGQKWAEARPESITACRDKVLEILRKECRPYVVSPEPAPGGKRR